MKNSTYPPFKVTCTVDVIMPGNDTPFPDLVIKLEFYIQCWDDIHTAAKREAKYRLERMGVDSDKLKHACFEDGDHEFIAIQPKGVKREYGVPVEAFYHCDPKKRDLLIRQRRLVPDSLGHMRELYGKPVETVKADVEAVPA